MFKKRLNGLQSYVADHSFFMGPMKQLIRTIAKDTRGATAIEYAAIGLFIIIVCVAGFTLLGGSSNGLMTNVSNKAGAQL